MRKVVLDLRSEDTVKRSMKEVRQSFQTLYGVDSDVILRKIARNIEVFYIRPMMNELRRTPPRRRYPIDYPVEYVSDRQRRYVMWLLDGKPYERTNKIVNAWGYKVKKGRGKISIEVFNKIPEFKYVVGLIGTGKSQRSIKRYLKPMQPFHAKTGWRPAHEIVEKYVSKARKSSAKTIRNWTQQSSAG